MSNYYGRANIRISRKSVNAALKDLTIASEKLSDDIMQSAAEYMADTAEEFYLGAIYDGATNDIAINISKSEKGTYTVSAVGDTVAFLEYGTGKYRNPGYTNPKTGKKYWFYTLPPGNRFGAGGTYAQGKRLKEDAVDLRTDRLERWFANQGKEGVEYSKKGMFEKTKHSDADYEYYDKNGSGITQGNPPNYVMARAVRETKDFLRDEYNAE